MKLTTLFAVLFSTSLLARTTSYTCENFDSREEPAHLHIKRSFFGNNLKGATVETYYDETYLSAETLLSADKNLLSELSAADLSELDPQALKYANSLNYKRADYKEGLLYKTDYYYLSEGLLNNEETGVLMIRDDYGCMPYFSTCSRRSFYICTK